MSYNVDSVEVLSSDNFRISGANLIVARERAGDDTAEDCFIRDLPDDPNPDAEYPITRPAWCGTWSGRSYDTLVDIVLPLTRGAADLVYTWEGGDSHTGVRVRDGAVSRHVVVLALGDRE